LQADQFSTDFFGEDIYYLSLAEGRVGKRVPAAEKVYTLFPLRKMYLFPFLFFLCVAGLYEEEAFSRVKNYRRRRMSRDAPAAARIERLVGSGTVATLSTALLLAR
jgi:hypothetical protein